MLAGIFVNFHKLHLIGERKISYEKLILFYIERKVRDKNNRFVSYQKIMTGEKRIKMYFIFLFLGTLVFIYRISQAAGEMAWVLMLLYMHTGKLLNYPTSQLAHNVGPPTARQRYAIQWRIAGGPLVALLCASWDSACHSGRSIIDKPCAL